MYVWSVALMWFQTGDSPRTTTVLELHVAHEGHQGIVKMKCRLCSEVWWPKMDADAEKVCKSCHGGQAVNEYASPEPVARAFLLSGPWQDCAADILGPLSTGESLLVVVDYFSSCFELVILRSTTSTRIIEGLKLIFARFGVPHMLNPLPPKGEQ